MPHLILADIVAGYRINRRDPFYRKINAWLYGRFLVRFMLGVNVRDINCAFKFIKKEVFDRVRLESDGALINAELLGKAVRKGFVIKQIGVHHFSRVFGEQTGAKLHVIFKMFIELFKLRRGIKFNDTNCG